MNNMVTWWLFLPASYIFCWSLLTRRLSPADTKTTNYFIYTSFFFTHTLFSLHGNSGVHQIRPQPAVKVKETQQDLQTFFLIHGRMIWIIFISFLLSVS